MEKLTAKLRVVVLVLVALALIPIVLHLWHGMLDFYGVTHLHRLWELFNIGNDY